MKQYDDLLLKAKVHHKASVSKILSLFENTSLTKTSIKHYIFTKLIQTNSFAPIFGFSGPPGAGKSTFIGKLTSFLIKNKDVPSIAIIAIDPSSQISKGALLADRTRINLVIDPHIFFRSQASHLEFGGLSTSTFSTMRILSLLYDIVLIETVGVGQNEVEIRYCSDFLYLIMSPHSGDQLQFLKSGIMEVPDSFIVHKADDKKNSSQTYHQLTTTLQLIQNKQNFQKKTPVFLASSHTKIGLETIFQHLLMIFLEKKQTPSKLWDDFFQKQAFFLKKKIKHIYGSYGFQFLKNNEKLLTQQTSYEEIYQNVEKIIQKEIKKDLNALHADVPF